MPRKSQKNKCMSMLLIFPSARQQKKDFAFETDFFNSRLMLKIRMRRIQEICFLVRIFLYDRLVYTQSAKFALTEDIIKVLSLDNPRSNLIRACHGVKRTNKDSRPLSCVLFAKHNLLECVESFRTTNYFWLL